jgi:dTDP-4-dehydrorhamnose 3,5-epimerase
MSVVVINTPRFEDDRGWFTESWNRNSFNARGISNNFIQDNHSYSRAAGTIRGLHFQKPPFEQAKLVRCLRGRIFDVAADLRQSSPTFGKWVGIELTAETGNQLFVPIGFAHGFMTLEPDCEVAYKVDSYYAPDEDAGIAWNDPDIDIGWPLYNSEPILSDKDYALPMLREAELNFSYDGNPLLSLKDLK